MNAGFDLRPWLEVWPYDPDNCGRVVRCSDGREVLQVRLSMGIEQYEMTGRPDGRRPYGKESVLDYHLERLAQAQRKGEEDAFVLSPEHCSELFTEAMLYYYRYLNLFQIRQWAPTVRDTNRNLRLFDLIHQHAERDEDRNYLETWRPYLMRIQATAAAMLQVESGDYPAAINLLQQTIGRISALPDREDQGFQVERKRSLLTLKELCQQLLQDRPCSTRERLQRELQEAIDQQEFERAAELRDQLRDLPQESAND